MNRIALFLPNWIGDVVMATPAVRAVRAAFPRAELVAVCKPYVADVLAGAPWFADTIFADKRGPRAHRFLAVLSRLRAKKSDAAVLFSNSFRVAALARLAGAKRVVGFARYLRGWMLTDKLHAKGTPAPIIDDYNRLATALGAPSTDHQMELFTTPADEAAADSVFAQFGLHRYSRVVLLNPGAAFGAAKHWPTEHFAQLARALTAKHACAALVLCGPAERAIARAIAESSRSPNVFALADSALSLGLTKALVKRCDLLVTTDSGPRHFAAAFGRPVVALFGPTHVEWTETYFAKEIQLQVKLPCGPCQQRACPLGHHRCMRELTPERALAACERLLRGEVRRVA